MGLANIHPGIIHLRLMVQGAPLLNNGKFHGTPSHENAKHVKGIRKE
jgi:hypothetical protein